MYVLRCRDGSLYTGWTSDLERRLTQHATGKGARYTASRLPVALAAAWPMSDRSAAMREEARVKRLTPAKKRALVAHWTASPVLPLKLGRIDERAPDSRPSRALA